MEQSPTNEMFYKVLWPQAATVLRMALVLTNHHHSEAEDLTQETMLKAFRSLDQFQPETNVKGWLLTILRNTWVDRLRQRKNRREQFSINDVSEEPAAPSASEPEPDWDQPHELLHQFADHDIIAALSELPDDMRWTLLLVDVQGLDQVEAADVMEVAVGTVKSRLHRGRRMLRDVLLPKARELGFLGRHDKQTETREVNP